MSDVRPEIQLSNGAYYHFLEPDPAVVTIEVIAHALSQINRFTGHTCRPYSVAEHSVRCSWIGPEDEALERLMHDAGEALTGDVSTPLKMQLQGYEPIESRAEALLATKFGYRFPYPPSVRIADRIMLATEKRDLLPQEGRPWKLLELVEPLSERIPIRGQPWWYWENAFLDRFYEIRRV